jgi:AcrR family transcriptional regulator
VGKTTIYRHWDSKEDLILDVLRELHVEIPMVDTGDLREDWARFFNDAMRIRSSNPLLIKLFMRLYAEADVYPQFIQMLFDQFFKERFDHAVNFIEAARARGEIREDFDPLLIIFLLGGPMIYAMFLSAMAPGHLQTDSLGESIVNAVMEGIQPRPNPKITS